uniref:Uncharacterized protein n=1 Tax=Leersia perrieri TaxID=77586 RepID=A0A0D9WDG2_9ORYZ
MGLLPQPALPPHRTSFAVTSTCHEDTDGAEQVDRSSGDIFSSLSNRAGKPRAEEWKKFTRIPNKKGKIERASADEGSSAPNPNDIISSAAIGNTVNGKRKRPTNGTSTGVTDHVGANTHPWSKAEFSNRIQQVVHQLEEAVSEVLRLRGSDIFSSSKLHQNTIPNLRLRTSSLLQRKMYGRVEEKNSIIKLMSQATSDGVAVLPIVGIGGIGKTALAQFVYNDPVVKSTFQQRIWVWVSRNFDEVRVTREMLDVVCHQMHEGLCSFAKLQDILMTHMKSERFLLVLDDVWDDMNNCRLNKLLAPLKYNIANGNVIIVTTRILSVAKRIGTVKPIKLGALNSEDSWMLFKSCAFGDENHQPCGSLRTIGQKLIDKLKGNPLAVETAGELLCEHHTVDHWNGILKNEDWKSLQLSGGIMQSLKRSYDLLPHHLQQCFLYCSTFPIHFYFCGEDLIRLWISQGFVKRARSNKRLEEIGEGYLTLLVNLGFFQQVETEESSPGNQTWYAMYGLMHDFAKSISRTDFATIDGPECTQILPTIRHLLILTDSSFCKDNYGNIMRNKRFEERLQSIATSANKLRTLVLIGQYDSFFFNSFKNVFQRAQNLRVLHIAAKCADFNSCQCEMVKHTHIRYIKLRTVQKDGVLPQVSSKFFHLQVLDVGSHIVPTTSNGINYLVSLRHLVAGKGVCSSIIGIGKMTSLQEIDDFSVQNSSGLEIAQLQSMNELVHLGVSRLERVTSQQKACGASLKDKLNLQKLHLSWRGAKDGYDSDMSYEKRYDSGESSESENDTDGSFENESGSGKSSENGNNINRSSESENVIGMISESSMYMETGRRLPTVNTNSAPSLEHHGGQSLEPSMETSEVHVLDGLEPHQSLKHLRISGYNGATSPTWLASSLTCLQTLHLEKCGKWRTLSLERLLLLRKIVLIKMNNVEEVSIPSPEELVLIGMQKLYRCICTSMGDLISSLRVLKIKRCPVFKVFPLFEYCRQFQIEWSSCSKLTIHDCPNFLVHNPLPPSNTVSKLSISGVLSLPLISGSSSETLSIRCIPDTLIVDDKVLSFKNLKFLKRLYIENCPSLNIPFDGFKQLISLKHLEICLCGSLFSSHVPQEFTLKDMTTENCNAFPSLEFLVIKQCGITGEWVWPSIYPDDMLTTSAQDGLMCIPSNLISSLKKISISSCAGLRFYGSKEGFTALTSLEKLVVRNCPELLLSLVRNNGYDEANGRWLLPESLGELEIGFDDSLKMLEPCFPGNLTRLKQLEVWNIKGLISVRLNHCTALQELEFYCCESLKSLEGLEFLSSLKLLRACECRCLRISDHGEDERCLLPQSLEELYVTEYSHETLKPCFLINLTCLKKLQVFGAATLKSLELQSCTALEHLKIKYCESLATLEGLQFLHSLRHLKITKCPSLPLCLESLSGQGYELCRGLERLQIDDPYMLTTSFCQHLNSLQFLELEKISRGIFFGGEQMERLTDGQERALQLLTSLQELRFKYCDSLKDIPRGLHSLPSLKRLDISHCERITRLPEKGLPPSLEELDISYCSKELTGQCRMLLASKVMVIIADEDED